jgi:hypothetical protein
VGHVGVWEAPWDYEDRVEQVSIPGLRYLHVIVPSRYDLAVMKLRRGVESDIEGIMEMHRVIPLDRGTLVDFYVRVDGIGERRSADITFCAGLSAIFGDATFRWTEVRLARLRGSKPSKRIKKWKETR